VVIEVTFKGNRREFFEWPFPEAPALRTPVIVEAERGEDLGRVHATGELAERRKAGTTHGKASPPALRKVIRAANGDEIARATQLREDERNVRTRAIEKVRSLGLDMKVSDTEWQWDRKRLTVYFTAEQRVDFRQLVRQLEGLFGTRVHMWHIGVRDEAKRVDGVGRCGRQLCSAGWLPELVPVKSSVAKDQHLSTLNPAQISGTCGRLMCCLRYEHEFYVQQRKRFPKEGKIVRTTLGEEKVVSLDIFREKVTLRSLAGDLRVVPLSQLSQETAGATATAFTAEDTEERSGDTGAVGADAGGDADVAYSADVTTDDSADAETRPVTREPAMQVQLGMQAQERAPGPAGGEHHQRGGRRRRRGRRGGRRGRGHGDRGGAGDSSGPPNVGPPNGNPAGRPPNPAS
jgi:cell fate regulator YaaT (PSP1 superfamily)